ncbi:MAG: transcription antiterminator NusG [Methylocystis sp.]|nr:transcription antiterminator NusG [Methylocystis sp.]
MSASTHLPERLGLAEGERWYVVRTLAHREAAAQGQLEAQGFRTFLPRVKRTVRHARKLRTVQSAAFPGYLFIILDLRRDRWRSVNGTRGVHSLIMGEESPIAAPRGVVEALIGYVDETGACRFDRDLEEGQAIRVVAGPLAQAIGELVKLDANGRVRVLLDIMGGKVLTVIERSSLAPA